VELSTGADPVCRPPQTSNATIQTHVPTPIIAQQFYVPTATCHHDASNTRRRLVKSATIDQQQWLSTANA
jgi:hypothetical protein